MLGLEVRLVLPEGSEGPSLVGRPSLNLVAVGTVLWSAAEVHGVWGSAWQWQPARPCGGLRCLRPAEFISRGTDWTPGERPVHDVLDPGKVNAHARTFSNAPCTCMASLLSSTGKGRNRVSTI